MALGLTDEANLAALLHDLGKYGDLFQKRLRREEAGIDHWTIGAWVALSNFNSAEVSLVVQGHHIGLQSADRESLKNLDPQRYPHGHRRLSETNTDSLLELQILDGVALPSLKFSARKTTGAHSMLRTRMLFSTLVDADYLDTASHFARTEDGPKIMRLPAPMLEADLALSALSSFRADLKSDANDAVKLLRNEVSAACAKAAEKPIGLFTLTAPTGSGKTLAMLHFALLHAKQHNLRRIIVVLPFLTLIEQTAKIYREIFKEFGQSYVLEDHSLARDEHGDESQSNRARLMAENWDAPIVITTNVRFFEALHHNRPSACRKLHRIGQSVVLCDEVQTIPLNVATPKSFAMTLDKAQVGAGVNIVAPTLATLASLSASFNTTVVFATATQPAFTNFGDAVLKLCPHAWQPFEIIPNVDELFKRSGRVDVEWRFESEPWTKIAQEICLRPGTLVIVNTRREATMLTKMVAELVPHEDVLHLSTNLCVAHRLQVLKQIKDRQIESRGFLIATQCVEAGVDLDFRQVYRAWAPLDAIAQAAGRCNRNGRADRGEVVVFWAENAAHPPGGYNQSIQAAKATVLSNGPENSVLHDPLLYNAFFERLYSATGITERSSPLEDGIRIANYADVAELYRLIPDSGDNIIVRIGRHLGSDHELKNQRLLDELRTRAFPQN